MSMLARCPKCAGTMIQGFVVDFSETGTLVMRWHDGPPKKSFWSGTKAGQHEGIPIGAFRCDKCGFLEFYANEEFAAK
jgi:hypothetical protein